MGKSEARADAGETAGPHDHRDPRQVPGCYALGVEEIGDQARQ